MQFVIYLSSAVQINGFTTRVVGPFNSPREAATWGGENDAALMAAKCEIATVETLLLGKVQS